MILITGGAGYIGSHTNKRLENKGFETVIFDNLSTGHRDFVKWGTLFKGDLSLLSDIDKVFLENKIDAVIHFAASAYVGESMKDPQKYYYNNVVNTLNLLNTMRKHDCNKIIFSSSCATYGEPHTIPIDENHVQNPINPYGKSKFMIENILLDYSKAYDLKYISLRYFNAAGADFDLEIGEKHNPETHLIPLLLDAATGKSEKFKIFGSDYKTKDGTCIRDFIHVNDLAQAHLVSLESLLNNGKSNIFNLGTGVGFSIFDVIKTVEEITSSTISTEICDRRSGDPAILVASSDKINKELKWETDFGDLNLIIQSAFNWHKSQ
mgnify:CR=1 FL=1|tara:strand:- start:35348 stop:36313 length:966 start_codon:yes stop_codon:yes gene_type:complete